MPANCGVYGRLASIMIRSSVWGLLLVHNTRSVKANINLLKEHMP